MKRIEIRSPAKINFGLNIVRKRDDGYHDIETIFYPLELADIMTFEPAESFSFATDHPTLQVAGENNLVLKALRMMERKSGRELPVKIELEKNIPLGAGLGGGSSNAATTLVSLNELFKLKVPEKDLRDMALQIGSDVPFFLKPFTSFATGRGEALTLINFTIDKPLLLVNPGIEVSTRWAYAQITPFDPEFSLKTIVDQKEVNFRELSDKVVNDFEEPVCKHDPELSALRDLLRATDPLYCSMSGSGSSFFAVYGSNEEARLAAARMPEEYFTHLEIPDE